ncbi:MAG: hypothetical protein Q4B54_09370 [Coriobacteriales bacterium]|nr:hypothetical protein [Coriobacteriales bacterium]
MEDLATLASAQDLALVETDDGIWLSATPESRYALRPGDVMRGNPSRESRELQSYVALLVLSLLLKPSNISSDLFITLERAVTAADQLFDSMCANDEVSEESKRLAGDWKSKPLGDVTAEDAAQKPNAVTKKGIVRYAIKFLIRIDLLEELPDQRWRASLRARALWPHYAEIGSFAKELKLRGIELGVDDYA